MYWGYLEENLVNMLHLQKQKHLKFTTSKTSSHPQTFAFFHIIENMGSAEVATLTLLILTIHNRCDRKLGQNFTTHWPSLNFQSNTSNLL